MAKIIWYENLKASLVILKKKKKNPLNSCIQRAERDEKLMLAETDATDKGEFSIPACLLRWGQGPDWEGVEHRGLAWEHITCCTRKSWIFRYIQIPLNPLAIQNCPTPPS